MEMNNSLDRIPLNYDSSKFQKQPRIKSSQDIPQQTELIIADAPNKKTRAWTTV